MQLPSGRGKVNAWGENHLWLRYRKGSKLSGLVEPRILVAKASESVKGESALMLMANLDIETQNLTLKCVWVKPVVLPKLPLPRLPI